MTIDPTSPFFVGAILGDRIRMQRHATDPGVFIRSMATRGHLGGLSRSAADAIMVMDAMGMDVVLVETVGVGQDEVDVVSTAHTSVVVVVPGLGDEIQAIKAGILEIADILVVNKADREGVERTLADLNLMLDLRSDHERTVEILKTVATRNVGIGDLGRAVDEHRKRLESHPEGWRRALGRAEVRLAELLRVRMMRRVLDRLAPSGGLASYSERVARRQLDPYTAADEIVGQVLGNLGE